MIRAKHFLWLLLGSAIGVFCATCAPVDPPGPQDGKPSSPAMEDNNEQQLSLTIPRSHGLKERIEMAIDQVRKRELVTSNGFWTIFHGILGLGPTLTLRHAVLNLPVNAVDYICSGGQIRGMKFIPTKDGLDVETEAQLFVGQGHQDQFIAEMAQWNMPVDRKFVVNGKEYTFQDFLNHTKARARVSADQELSWAIIILGQYFGTDLTWTNGSGEKLRFEDVVRYELEQPIETAACGGTHRLFGLTWVEHLHLLRGGKLAGVWQEITDKEQKYHKRARELQNADGSFSTKFFKERDDSRDRQARIYSTGHILEWLALSLPDSELRAPWVENAVNALTLMFFEIQNSEMEGGALYHATHGLIIYYARAFDAKALGEQNPPVPFLPTSAKKKGPP